MPPTIPINHYLSSKTNTIEPALFHANALKACACLKQSSAVRSPDIYPEGGGWGWGEGLGWLVLGLGGARGLSLGWAQQPQQPHPQAQPHWAAAVWISEVSNNGRDKCVTP